MISKGQHLPTSSVFESPLTEPFVYITPHKMFRLATAPLSVRLLSNIVVKPYFLNVNVRLNNSSDSPDSIYKSHLHAFVNILDTNGDGFISRKDFVEDLPKRFAAIVDPPQETIDRLQAVLSEMAKVG